MENYIPPPPGGPRPVGLLAAIAAGAYTNIVSIIAPVEADYGQTVNITVKVKNIGTYSFYIVVTGNYDGVDAYFSPDYALVEPGQIYSFTYSFTMPNNDVRFHVWSWYWTGEEWYQDDYGYVDIAVEVAVPESEFRNISIYSIEPSEAEIGDTVRITARVEHRGAADIAAIYAAIGVQGVWFDEILHGERTWNFPESTDWESWLPYADILITSAIAQGVYDAYVKVKAPLLVSPTVYDCVTIVGVPTEPEFRGFKVAEYTKR